MADASRIKARSGIGELFIGIHEKRERATKIGGPLRLRLVMEVTQPLIEWQIGVVQVVDSNPLSAFDFCGRHRDPVPFRKHLIPSGWTAADANQIVARLGLSHLTLEQVGDRHSRRDVQVVGEAAAVIVYK